MTTIPLRQESTPNPGIGLTEPELITADHDVLSPSRWRRVKRAYSVRDAAYGVDARLAAGARVSLLTDPTITPRSGDLVLARVKEIGQHQRLESPVSRRQKLFPGDEVVVSYGHRYAPDQFEAEVPEDLGEVSLVAAGGLAGRVTAKHGAIADATTLEPIGLLADEDGRITLPGHAARPVRYDARPVPGVRVIAVLGTSMNSGKSTSLAYLVRGLTEAGLRVHAGKVTGTGAGGDPGLFTDAGAAEVTDFTHYGYASTFRLDHGTVRALATTMIEDLSGTPEERPDVVVIEVADGLYQPETARLLADPTFGRVVDQLVFAAGEALGAVAGRQVLSTSGIPVAAVTGVLTSSPLAAREARDVLDVPLIDTDDLRQADTARALLG